MVDHASFDVGRRAFVFLHQRAGQHEVGVARRLRHEEVDHGEELEAAERFPDEVAVWQRDCRVEAEQQQSFDAALVDRLEQRHGRQAGVRDRRLLDAPDTGDVLAVRRVLEIPGAGKLIAFLTLLACALTVALAGDHGVAAAFAPDAAGGHDQVDARPCSSRRPSSGARCRARAAGSCVSAGPHISAARTIIDAGTLAIVAAYSGRVALDDRLDRVPARGVLRR